MPFQNVMLKVGSMRKTQEFTIFPNGTSPDFIIIQSDNRIGSLNKHTGEFKVTPAMKSHPSFIVLQLHGEVTELPEIDKESIRRGYNAMSNGNKGQIRIL